MHGGT